MQYVARVANSINVGRAGEFLVAAELEHLEPRQERYREAHYVFTRANGDAQIFAYVALGLRLFILRTAPIGKTVRIKPAEFTPQAMADSIAAHLY
jgi:hypothetical protein